MKTSRQILLCALLTLCLVALVSCAEKKEEEEAEGKDEPRGTLIIEPLVGIGPVKFGMSKDEVIEHFGWPDKTHTGETVKLNYVASRGLGLTIHPELGLQMIQCWSKSWPKELPFAVSAFTGRTKEGIGIGATRDEIIAAYGQPDRTTTGGKEYFENLHYDKLQSKFTLWQSKVNSMTLEAPK